MSRRVPNAATTFADLAFSERDDNGYPMGIWALTEYPNGYGASVIQSWGSYGGDEGLYELAVFHDGRICYTTEITDDVLGRLTEDEVTALLQRIADLPAAGDRREARTDG